MTQMTSFALTRTKYKEGPNHNQMFCKRCGQRLEAVAALCAACGASTYIHAGYLEEIFCLPLGSFIINARFILLAALFGTMGGFVDSDLFQTEEMAQAAIEGIEPLLVVMELLI